MKHFLVSILIFVLTLTLAGCNRAPTQEPGTPAANSAGTTEPETAAIEPSLPANGQDGDADWGITLSVENATPTGLTLVISQSGGEPTGELQFGSPYWLEVRENGDWQAVPETPSDVERGWDAMAYLVPTEGSTEDEINWEWIYGELPPGTYRICKELMDFREAGDWDTEVYWAVFSLTDE